MSPSSARRRSNTARGAIAMFVLSAGCCLALPISHRSTPEACTQRRDLLRQTSKATTSTTTTTLCFSFDKFLHPYGIISSDDAGAQTSPRNDNGELLDALLPQLPTGEGSRMLNVDFQRARLYEQLRLSKINRSMMERKVEDTIATNLVDSFQRARLAEQFRLNRRGRRMTAIYNCIEGVRGARKNGGIKNKSEAFHRALLEERLRIKKQHNDFIDGTTKLIQENEIKHDFEGVVNLVKHNEDYAIDMTSNSDDGGGNSNVLSVGRNLDRTKEVVMSIQLDAKLEKLRQMVKKTSTPSCSTIDPVSNNDAPSSLQSFLSTTYLPLPPREDASSLSLVLSPVAHLISSLFLLGATGLFALMAVLDVICFDVVDEDSTRACMQGTKSIYRSCWDYVWYNDGDRSNGIDMNFAARRTILALQTSIIASYYTTRCILHRSTRHSKYANDSIDAFTGSLRYLVYTARATNITCTRVMGTVRRMYDYIVRRSSAFVNTIQLSYHRNQDKTLRHKLHQMLLNIKSSTMHRVRKLSSQQDALQRLQSDALYNQKLHLLNLDRVALERERQQILRGWKELELEKHKLLAEGMTVLSWYAAAVEIASRESNMKPKERNQIREFWRRKNDRNYVGSE
jgi:hypothetical protein